MRRLPGFLLIFITCLPFQIGASFAQISQCSAVATSCACVAPCVWTGSACTPPSNISNACDDGSVSGNASVVAPSVQGATAAAKFNAIINKKLACCLNPYDPSSPSQVKYDCVDNSNIGGASFDAVWTGTDPADSGSQPYAMVLTTGGHGSLSGSSISGFYTLGGARCAAFSEFAGTIRGAKVNPGQIGGQQDSVTASSGGPSCAILPSSYTVTPPSSLTAAVTAIGKTVPYDGFSTSNCDQAQKMRQCPILVRAALVATCPSNPAAPIAQPSYSDGTNIHCSAASVLRIYVRIEQIYEIAGMPTLPTIDTYQSSITSNSLSIANILQLKVGTTCPGNTSLHNNVCMGCAAGCGGVSCQQCPANTYSTAGDTVCSSCPPNLPHSPPGSTSQVACTL